MEYIFDGPIDGPLFIFAHGAGADAQSEFMTNIAQGLAQQGIRVARFNFPYMQQRLIDGIRRPPNRVPQLIEFFSKLVRNEKQPVYIGGKSMGGRIASMVAAQNDDELNEKIKGVICLGYPFHPQAKPEKLRIEHLKEIKAPLFIAQGTRDKLGSLEDVTNYELEKDIDFLWLEDGDHDFKPRVKSGLTRGQHLRSIQFRLITKMKN
jgi:predicted alpha/beta-hydrolase family hydrolase